MTGKKLTKTLSVFDVFCIASGAMISSGIFVLPGIAYRDAGPAIVLAYLVAGLCALVGALATVELSTAMPLAGGIYFYTGRSLGPLAGTISGLLDWSAISLKSSFAIFGMAEVLYLFCGVNPVWCGVGLTMLFLAINLIGTKEAAIAQNLMVILLLASMGAFFAFGVPHIELSRFSPFFQPGKSTMLIWGQAAFVFVSFGGLLDVASISEEVKNPRRALPWGMLGGLVAVLILYVLTLVTLVGVLPADELKQSLTPLADAAQKYYGSIGFWVLTIGALLAFITTGNAGIMAAARYPFAMGRDRLIPQFFSRTAGKRNIPLPALLCTGALMAGAQFLKIEDLVKVASTVVMLEFFITNLSVIILRESGVLSYRPTFRVPFYPFLPIISMGLFCILIVELGIGAVQIAIGIAFCGLVLYALCGRKVSVTFALTHLIERITRNRMESHHLEEELREIVIARDNIQSDDFDQAVRHAAVVLDPESRTFQELLGRLASEFPLLFDQQELWERELVSGTVLAPLVAIPHLEIPGSGKFEMLLVKSPSGVLFPDGTPAVSAIIFLFASKDMRNLHLRSLAAIAQIIQSPKFEARWKQAKSAEQLRDLFLLAHRKRIRNLAV